MAHVFGRKRPSSTGQLVGSLAQPTDRTQHRRKLPKPTGQPPFRLDLKGILSGKAYKSDYDIIVAQGRMVFQMAGDTGSSPNSDNRAQLNVVAGLEQQFVNGTDIANPAFFYSCGDCIYFNGELAQYRAQFYEPYEFYPRPVFAIPGNHDGENLPGQTSLDAFVRNFCAKVATHAPEASDIPRTTMVQPNVYWMLLTPVARIIGLYTNVEPGGDIDAVQQAWLTEELAAAGRDLDRAVFLTMHHPIYSLDDFHSGSPHVQKPVMQAIKDAGRYPDIVIGGHVHNMQRFTVQTSHGPVPYLVAGAGGYNNLHKMQKQVKISRPPISLHDDAYNVDYTLQNYCDDEHGFFRFDVSADLIIVEYYTVPRPQDPYARGPRIYERFTYDWKTRSFASNPMVGTNEPASNALPLSKLPRSKKHPVV